MCATPAREYQIVTASDKVSDTVKQNVDIESPEPNVAFTNTERVDTAITSTSTESLTEFGVSTSTPTSKDDDIFSSKRKRSKINIAPCFERLGSKGRKKIRFSICFKHPDMVKLHNKSDQVLPICTEVGSEIRAEYMGNLLKSSIHTAACRQIV